MGFKAVRASTATNSIRWPLRLRPRATRSRGSAQRFLCRTAAVFILGLTAACNKPGDGDAGVTSAFRASKATELGFAVPKAPQSRSAVRFSDATGRPLTLADFHGKVLLVNLWGTWCPPCREEMPSLDRLQQALGSRDFEVVALSLDPEGAPAVAAFYAQTGLRHLQVYLDPAASSMKSLGVRVVPATLIVDREGNEIARFVGVRDWDRPEVVLLLRDAIEAPAAAR